MNMKEATQEAANKIAQTKANRAREQKRRDRNTMIWKRRQERWQKLSEKKLAKIAIS